MRILMNALELLRPLVESKAWDYCVVWKFGDDPSRFIEWIGCCCSGSHGVYRNVKEENDENRQHMPYLCKDTYIKHALRTNACEKLATIPSSLPLYPGIHGEVAMSAQPFWLSNDLIGTQVLVPVDGGLIELFRSKQVPEDQKMIETLTAQLGIITEHGFQEKDSKTHLNSYPYHNIVPKLQLLFPVPQPVAYLNALESSTGESKVIMSAKRMIRKEDYQSKNLVTERNRRKRIKDGLYALRALVPNISKMDRASIIGDAIEYIKELQKNVEELQGELKELEEQDWKVNDGEVEDCKPKRAYEISTQTPFKKHNRVANAVEKQNEVQVEVHKIGDRDFLVKLTCIHKRGGFMRIMEIIDSLGLQVSDANVTTYNGHVLNILNVKAKGKDFAAKSLKDSLLTSWSSSKLDRNPTRKA